MVASDCVDCVASSKHNHNSSNIHLSGVHLELGYMEHAGGELFIIKGPPFEEGHGMHMWSNVVASDDTLVDICEKTYICIFEIAIM